MNPDSDFARDKDQEDSGENSFYLETAVDCCNQFKSTLDLLEDKMVNNVDLSIACCSNFFSTEIQFEW